MNADMGGTEEMAEKQCRGQYSQVKISIHVFRGEMTGNEFDFSLFFPPAYPYSPPSVFLLPSDSPQLNGIILQNFSHLIEMQTGRIQLPIFTTEWKPILDFSMIMFELQLLVSTPAQVANH